MTDGAPFGDDGQPVAGDVGEPDASGHVPPQRARRGVGHPRGVPSPKSTLTALQEQFARNIVDGMSARDAYVAARGRGLESDHTGASIRSMASVMLRKPIVLARIEELRNLAASPVVMALRARKEELSRIASTAKAPRDRISAIDLLNKIDGVYVSKVLHTGKVILDFQFD